MRINIFLLSAIAMFSLDRWLLDEVCGELGASSSAQLNSNANSFDYA
jgi:hypothetical protein